MKQTEHPTITAIEATGYASKEPEPPVCPICGAECEKTYADKFNEIFACNKCVIENDAWECGECFPKEEI